MPPKIRFAMVGCGHIAPRWLDVFAANPDTDLIAIADPNPKAFDVLKKYSFPHLHTYSTFEQVIENEKPNAIAILTPPQYHARYIIEGIEAGVHVLTEKPLCTDLGQLHHIQAALPMATKKKLITAVNQQYRWNPRIQAIHDAVQQGLLGDVFAVHSEFNQNNYKFSEWWRRQEEYISLFNWFVHPIDTMRYYLNQHPIQVWARFIHPPHSKILGYSSMILHVTFDKGTEWVFSANQESIAGPTTSGHTTFTMYGTQGTLFNPKNEAPMLFTPDGKKTELGENIAAIDNESTYPPGWDETVAKFVHSIRTGEPHPCSITDNFETIGILFAAIKSHETGRTVALQEILR